MVRVRDRERKRADKQNKQTGRQHPSLLIVVIEVKMARGRRTETEPFPPFTKRKTGQTEQTNADRQAIQTNKHTKIQAGRQLPSPLDR